MFLVLFLDYRIFIDGAGSSKKQKTRIGRWRRNIKSTKKTKEGLVFVGKGPKD